jgi:hypothetical protein
MSTSINTNKVLGSTSSTSITGGISTGTAPYLITAPTLSDYTICGIPGNGVTIQSMVLGGTPTPTLTYNWQGILGEGYITDFGQYTNTFYVDYSLIGWEYWCEITATNSAGVLVIQTPSGLVYDCS